MASPLYEANKYTYRVLRDENKQRFVGVCSEFPALTYEATTMVAALAGIESRVAEEISEHWRQRKMPPEPLVISRLGKRKRT